jgi:hypothetical protein
MQVVWQHTNRNGLERIPLLRSRVDPSETVDVSQQEITRAICDRDSEEENTALNLRSAIPRHGAHI